MAAPGRKVGFFAGAGCFFEGAGFVASTPRIWPNATVPVVMALLLLALVGGLGVWGGVRAAIGIVGDDASGASAAAGWVLRIVFGVVAVLLAILSAMALAQPLSGWALDGIVRRQEAELGVPPWPEHPFFPQALRSLAVSLTALLVGGSILVGLSVVELLAAPAAVVCEPLKFIVGALMLAWDFLDYPMGLRGQGVGQRAAWVRAHFGAVLGFGMVAGVVLLVPCIGLLVLPMGVAGATRLLARIERAEALVG